MSTLKIGDVVMWRGSWGREDARPATIYHICVCKTPGNNDDVSSRDSIAWSMIKGREVVVDVSPLSGGNNHWAWGFQVQPISKGEL